MFNIILPKPCENFAKCLLYVQYYFTKILWNLCQIFGKSLTEIWFKTDPIFNQYNSVNVGRMIYFRENSNGVFHNLHYLQMSAPFKSDLLHNYPHQNPPLFNNSSI